MINLRRWSCTSYRSHGSRTAESMIEKFFFIFRILKCEKISLAKVEKLKHIKLYLFTSFFFFIIG